MNDGLPESTRSHRATRCLPVAALKSVSELATSNTRTSASFVHQTQPPAPNRLSAVRLGEMTSAIGCTEFSLGTVKLADQHGDITFDNLLFLAAVGMGRAGGRIL